MSDSPGERKQWHLIVDLDALPLSVQALPLLMVYQGPRKQDIVEFVLEHGRGHRLFLEQAFTYHSLAVKEVLAMRSSSIEAYRKLVNPDDINNIIDALEMLFGRRALIERIGEEDVIREIGEEKIIREIGEERLVEDLIAGLGAERLRELVERKLRERDDTGSLRQHRTGRLPRIRGAEVGSRGASLSDGTGTPAPAPLPPLVRRGSRALHPASGRSSCR
ncbi:MAG: hypothetical protein HY321_18095 [Armatimonadetes bacterium]|nr:hypothetical protein [Armatimonadota bacterium]